jgi:hypothetical protein
LVVLILPDPSGINDFRFNRVVVVYRVIWSGSATKIFPTSSILLPIKGGSPQFLKAPCSRSTAAVQR